MTLGNSLYGAFLGIFFFLITIQNCQFIDYSKQSEWPGLCNIGKKQSPIEFSEKIRYIEAEGYIHFISIEYHPLKNIKLDFHKKNQLGFNFKPEDFGGFKIEIGNVKLKYDLISMTFHSPAEHITRGIHCDLEIQLKHKIDKDYLHCNTLKFEDYLKKEHFNIEDNEYLIISILLKSQKGHINKDIENLHVKDFKKIESFDLRHYVTKIDSFYFYNGSSTIPDCEENVNWLVFERPHAIGEDQLNEFKEVFIKHGYSYGNQRHAQDLHDRDVYYHSPNA